jgi:hypothetical protein
MKACNTEYVYDLVKRCRHMRHLKNKETRCKCSKKCAMCSVGGNVTRPDGTVVRKVEIWMHPQLHEEYIKSQASNIRSNETKEVTDVGSEPTITQP